MIHQIVIEAEPPGDAKSMFRLSINANLIARGVTAAQAYYLVGEILRRIGFAEVAETVAFDADGGVRESVRGLEVEAETLDERASWLTQGVESRTTLLEAESARLTGRAVRRSF